MMEKYGIQQLTEKQKKRSDALTSFLKYVLL